VPFVLDASAVLAWYLPDEQDDDANAAYDRLAQDNGLAPAGWPGEVVNGILLAERRRRSTPDATARALVHLQALPIRVAPAIVDETWADVLDLARQHNLTAYDAAYLELAIRERAALATLDDDLAAAARRAGVALVVGT
jgi:predicted nucleic acid-binding protein